MQPHNRLFDDSETRPVIEYAKRCIASAPIDDDQKEFLAIFLEPPWVFEASVAWTAFHCSDLIAAENYLTAGIRFKVWADQCRLFHEQLGEEIKHIFAGVVVLGAKRLLQDSEGGGSAYDL